MSSQLKPLGGVLDDVINRLAAIEAQLGITPPSVNAPSNSAETAAAVIEEELHPRVVAYDEHITRALIPFTESCKALGTEMDAIGASTFEAWDGMRGLVELGTVYKRPSGDVATAIQPHLKPCQDAIAKVQSARLDRKFDWHIKAVKEMLSCVSWVVISPPPSPANFVKDTVGASDFWANKIRKEYKTNGAEGPVHIQFCDAMKALVNDLSSYLKEHHLSGLAWNPRGKDFSEAIVGEALSAKTAKSTGLASQKPAGGSSSAGIFDELKNKQTGDGSSAATGLKKVTRDQQTWRKEYKKPDVEVPQQKSSFSAAPTSKVAVKAGEKTLGPPTCEYQERGFKWNIENQTKENCEGGLCKVEVTDSKQQVYIYNCHGVTIQIIGKLKSVILDSCTKCGVLFDTAISACEIVNCKSVQVQATNLCPSFSIDKTDGCVVHLTNEAVRQSSFVTSKSSEMNVSWPDDKGEIREAPIPEQFVHKIVNGSVTSQVSDLYH